MRRLAILLAAVMLPLSAVWADQVYFKVDSIKYVVLSPNTVSAAWGYADKSGVIEVPAQVVKDGQTYTVTSVGSYKFSNGFADYSKNKITTVKLPTTITSLGKWAFNQAKDLVSINLPSSLTEIDWEAFNECTSLPELVIPNSVKTIGGRAVSKCTNLRKIVIPNSVEAIGPMAFDGCRSLTVLDIPNSVKKLGCHIVDDCESLTTLILPDRAPVIDTYVPWDTSNMFYYYCTYCIRGDKLQTIRGHYLPVLSWVVDDMVSNDYVYAGTSIRMRDSYTEMLKKSPWAQNHLNAALHSFTYWGGRKTMDQMEAWQKKKEYETTAQYQQRMSMDNRKEQLSKIVAQLKQEFIKEKVPEKPYIQLGAYDADYGTYPVKVNGITTYAQVPIADAPLFKEKFGKVEVSPTYNLVGDTLAITACTYKLKGKTYQSTQTYTGDNSNDMLASLPPIDFDLGLGPDNSNGAGGNANNGLGNGNNGGGNGYGNGNALGGGNNGDLAPAPATTDDLDTNIPAGKNKNAKTFAVIIGNENYQRVATVPYANNDAAVFAKYCQKTLGIPSQNIRSYKDATYGTMLTALQDIRDITDAFEGEANVIFYYAGHGIPGENDQKAYLLPVDADGRQTQACLPLADLYKSLSELKAKSVVAILDACFSGAQRGEGMLASARGVAIKPKAETPQGNLVVISAASNDETAFPYKEKRHGLFTYYLLKDLQQSKGQISLGQLADDVSRQVKQQSVVINRKKQSPTVSPSPTVAATWRDIQF